MKNKKIKKSLLTLVVVSMLMSTCVGSIYADEDPNSSDTVISMVSSDTGEEITNSEKSNTFLSASKKN